jgi:hypothetical protein
LAAAEFRLFHRSVDKPVESRRQFTPEALKYQAFRDILHMDSARSAISEVSLFDTSTYVVDTTCLPADFVPFWNIMAAAPCGGRP